MKTLWLLLFISASLAAQNWALTFDEEFNGNELDLSKWTLHDPLASAPGKSVQEYAPDGVTVNGGQLHLIAKPGPAGTRSRTSGIITTFGLFAQTYGRFEMRFRAPSANGLRPEFVLLPVPTGILPKIDVLQTTEPRKVHFANHWGTEQTERSYGDSFPVPDLSIGFHTVAIEWERDRITWFVDEKKTFESVDGIPRQQMYLVIDLLWNGDTAASSFDVDYVRVYKQPGQQKSPVE